MEAYILILGVVNILVILVTYSNIKRISALERDLSEQEQQQEQSQEVY